MAGSREWQAIHSLEDAMAVLSDISDRQGIIKRQSWRGGSFDQIFDEAIGMEESIRKLRQFMSAEWQAAVAIIRGE